MTETTASLMILVAGPYRSGTQDEPERLDANLRLMHGAALRLFRAGHLPVTGEDIGLPLVVMAGSRQIGDGPWDEIMHPIGSLLASRCDATLRVGGPSKGADLMVDVARRSGKLVFDRIEDVPGVQ